MGERRRFGLGWGLAVSVLFHLVLLVLSWFFPLELRTPQTPPEETTLRFTLTPVTDATAEVEPKGTRPVPAPATPPSRPQEPAVLPVPIEPPPAEPELEDVVEPEQPPGTIEEKTTGARLPREGPAPVGEGERSSRSMERALSDFRRALSAPRPPAESSQDQEGLSRGMNTPDLPPVPFTGFGFGNLQFESRDFDWSDYARQIYMAIWRAWHNRLYVTADVFERWAHENSSWLLAHQSQIRFTIQRNGQVTGIALEGPSGCYPLDDSALDALKEVILPPLPEKFPREQETVHARFIADGDVRTMRRFLGRLKRYGYF